MQTRRGASGHRVWMITFSRDSVTIAVSLLAMGVMDILAVVITTVSNML